METKRFIILLALVWLNFAPYHTRAQAQGLDWPGIWAEAESGRGTGTVHDNPEASGGKEVVCKTLAGPGQSVSLKVSQQIPQATLYLRYKPPAVTEHTLDVYLAPVNASSRTARGSRRLGRLTAKPTGKYLWASLNAGKVETGHYRIFLVESGRQAANNKPDQPRKPVPEECTFDLIGLTASTQNGLWIPPNEFFQGKPVGQPSVLPKISIAPISAKLLGNHYPLPDNGKPLTAGYILQATNNSTSDPATLQCKISLTDMSGSPLWESTQSATLKPHQSHQWSVDLPPIKTPTAAILTVNYFLDGESLQTDHTELVVTRKIGGLDEILDQSGQLIPGYYEGNLKIERPITLEVASPGLFVLYGSLVVSNAKDVVLKNLVIQNLSGDLNPTLSVLSSTHCQIEGCTIRSTSPARINPPTALAVLRTVNVSLRNSLILGDGAISDFTYCKDINIQGCTFYPDSYVGSQFGKSMRLNDSHWFTGLGINKAQGLSLLSNHLQSPGLEAVALKIRNTDDFQSDQNTFWGVCSLSGSKRSEEEAIPRNLSDWRDLTGQDGLSRSLKRDMIRHAVLGAIDDPSGVQARPRNIQIPLPEKQPAPGTTYAMGVFDGEDRLVRTLRSEVEWSPNGVIDAHWDGTNNLRQPAAPGQYQARAYEVQLNPRQGWIGSTYPIPKERFQNDVAALFVSPDGKAYTNTPWDEMGREAAIYGPDGHLEVGLSGTHGWGNLGGREVAASEKFVFISTLLSHVNDPRDFPPKGETWYGVKRFTKDGKDATWPEGKGGTWKNQYVMATAPCVSGLAAGKEILWISDSRLNVVRAVEQTAMKEVKQFPFDRPGHIALDHEENLWIMRLGDATHLPEIVRVTSNGKPNLVIRTVKQPAAIAVDEKGRLLVADNSTFQVRFFDVTGTEAKEVKVLGEPGGVWAGPVPGATGNYRFRTLTGVGSDSMGNVWVSLSGDGAELRKFSPDGRLLWNLQALTFVDGAAADPASPEDIYTKSDHYKLDYSTDPPSWRQVGHTIPRNPNDPRKHHGYASVQAARIQGKLFLYLSPMYSQRLTIFRVDGEQLMPVGVVQRQPTPKDWPHDQPTIGRWIWRDLNGDSTFQFDEVSADGKTESRSWNWHVDESGDIWVGYEDGHSTRIPCLGLDQRSNPIYEWSKADQFSPLAPIQKIRAVVHKPGEDALYVFGANAQYFRDPAEGWGPAGIILARYDNLRILRWQTLIDTTMHGMALAVSGGLAFTTDMIRAELQVFDAETGLRLGTFGAGKRLGYAGSWVDFPMSLQAVTRPDGEVIVLNEDDWATKIVLYGFRPVIKPIGSVPAPLTRDSR